MGFISRTSGRNCPPGFPLDDELPGEENHSPKYISKIPMLIHKTKPSTFKGLKPVTPAVGNSGRVCSSLPQMVISQQVHLGVCGVFGEPPASARGTSSASWGNEGMDGGVGRGWGERQGGQVRQTFFGGCCTHPHSGHPAAPGAQLPGS